MISPAWSSCQTSTIAIELIIEWRMHLQATNEKSRHVSRKRNNTDIEDTVCDKNLSVESSYDEILRHIRGDSPIRPLPSPHVSKRAKRMSSAATISRRPPHPDTSPPHS